MIDKKQIVADIRRDFAAWLQEWKPDDTNPAKLCFYLAVFVHRHLKNMGGFGRCLISAGSFNYPRINLALDDGKIDTHFGYIFTPDGKAMDAVKRDEMPEMHCWVQLPDRGEIVDLTTCYLKLQCEQLSGLKWETVDPPDFLWCSIEDLPYGVQYEPVKEAVALVQYFFELTWGN